MGYPIAGVAAFVVLAVATIVVVAQHLWLPIQLVGAAWTKAKAVGAYRRSRDYTYGLPPA